MSYARRRRPRNDEQSDDAQSEAASSPARQIDENEFPPSDGELDSDHGEEQEAELDAQIAELLAHEMPNLRDAPLQFSPPQIYTQNLDLISRDITRTEKLILQQIEALTEVASQAEEFEMTSEVEKTEATVKALLDQIHIVQAYQTSFNRFKSALLQARGEPIEGSLVTALETAIAAETEAYRAKSSRAKYSNSTTYREFKQRLWEINHPDEVMPPLSDDGGSEDDIVVARQVENFKCPLTATWFEDPVTSSDCSHTFSRAAIVELLRASPNGLISCPITGCSKNLSSNVLKPNAGLVRRMGRARELQTKRPNGSKTNFTVLES